MNPTDNQFLILCPSCGCGKTKVVLQRIKSSNNFLSEKTYCKSCDCLYDISQHRGDSIPTIKILKPPRTTPRLGEIL